MTFDARVSAPSLRHLPEDELIARAIGRESAAFEVLMRRHNQLMFRTARSILPNDAEAEDAAQEAWLHAWRALPRYRAESRLATWLVRIVMNESLGRLRRKHAQNIPLETAMRSPHPKTQAALTQSPSRGPEQQLERAELRRLIEAGIDMLPDIYRTVFMLRAVEEMSVKEVAAVTDLTEETVRSRYFRARSLPELELIYESINQLEPIELEGKYYRPVTELYVWPGGAALILWLLLLLARQLTTWLRARHQTTGSDMHG
jgi:RNA polymerase sigma-70 factor (ECF subfamily)